MGQILDIDELPRLASITVYCNRLIANNSPDENGDYGFRTGPLTERNAVAHNGEIHTIEIPVVLAEQLGGNFRRGIEVVRISA